MYRHGNPSFWPRRSGNADAVDHGSSERESNPRERGEEPRGPEPPLDGPELLLDVPEPTLDGPEVSPSRFGVGRKRRLRRYRKLRRMIMSATAFDRKFWRHLYPDLAKIDEKGEEEDEKAKEKVTIKPEEAEKVEELTIREIDFNIEDNSTNHHTSKYHDAVKPVLRRGQEFVIIVTFDRVYRKDKDDLIFIFKADDESKCKNLYVEFRLDEDGTGSYKKDEDWGAKILKSEDEQMWLEIYIPGDCVVGQWSLEMKTALVGKEDDYVYECERPLFVLFNPWSKKDQVYYTGEAKELDEYVLNQMGAVFRGIPKWVRGSHWTYDQFREGMLEASLSILRKSFGYKMSVSMKDAKTVSRNLSCIVNACDNEGVLVGNWSRDYSGGTSPSSWSSSADILREYVSTERPVKYGQCWVFSHVLTAVCRALGLPCRSVTTFDSAHDTDNTCTIDDYKDGDGNKVAMACHDSVWNFHVWNEVWILRPEFPQYEGWHAIDATPQETSMGMYQCGPCPVEAIKQGDITVGYDTAFVFSEVNADRVFWLVKPDKSLVVSRIETNGVGHAISTKKPDGKRFERGDRPVIITGNYKYPEGSEEERKSVERAVRYRRHGRRLYDVRSDFEMSFDTGDPPTLGEDIVVKATVQNVTNETKKITMRLAARTCRYWDRSRNDKHLARETFEERTLEAGQAETYELIVPESVYLDKLDDSMGLFVYACATDVDTDMPSSAEESVVVKLPDLDIQGPETAKTGETVTVTVSLTNTRSTPLTNIRVNFTGSLDIAEDDKNDVEEFFYNYVINMPPTSIEPKETFTLTLRLVDNGGVSDCREMRFTVGCDQFPTGLQGAYVLEVQGPAPH